MLINQGIRLSFSQYKGAMTQIMRKINLFHLRWEREVTRTEMIIEIRTITNLIGTMNSITIDKADKGVVVVSAGVTLKVAVMEMVKNNNLKSLCGDKSKEVHLTQTMKKIYKRT